MTDKMKFGSEDLNQTYLPLKSRYEPAFIKKTNNAGVDVWHVNKKYIPKETEDELK